MACWTRSRCGTSSPPVRTNKLAWKQVIIEQDTGTTQDAAGGLVSSYVEFARRYAGITTLQGRELMAAQARHAETTHSMNMRYVSGLTTHMRLRLGVRYFAITFINDVDERHREHVVECKEGLLDE